MMLYIGMDLHRKQVTVCVRDEQGNVVVRRQVSTRPERMDEFGQQLHEFNDRYVAVVEVCGFHDWLVKWLQQDPWCHEVVLIQPEKKSRKKTDRRDANALSETLWVNRGRLLAGQKVQGIRRVYFPNDEECQDRQLTSVRQRLGKQRTKTLNQMHYILRRHNLEWKQPTKGFQTKAVKKWLQTLPLQGSERLELDQLLEQWDLWDRQIEQLDRRIGERFLKNDNAKLLTSIVGVSFYMALAIASRIGDIRRFASPRSLANFFGLTPTCQSSGQIERLGSISKAGSAMVRFLLGQLVMHVLRRDPRMRAWYKRIQRRRGSKIARVAVMRRLTVIIWHMLSKQVPYEYRLERKVTDESARKGCHKAVGVDVEIGAAAAAGKAGSAAGE